MGGRGGGGAEAGVTSVAVWMMGPWAVCQMCSMVGTWRPIADPVLHHKAENVWSQDSRAGFKDLLSQGLPVTVLTC